MAPHHHYLPARRDLSTAMAPLCAGKGLDLAALGLDPRAPLIPAAAAGAPPSPTTAGASSGPTVTWASFASSLRGLHDVLVTRHAEAEAAWAAVDSRGKGRIDALELRQVRLWMGGCGFAGQKEAVHSRCRALCARRSAKRANLRHDILAECTP